MRIVPVEQARKIADAALAEMARLTITEPRFLPDLVQPLLRLLS